MSKYRISANLVWDIDEDDQKVAEKIAMEQLLKMANSQKIKLRKPKIGCSKLKDSAKGTVLNEYKPDDILSTIPKDGHRREFVIDGKTYKVKMNSQRYHCFAANKKCVCCGIEGTKILLELQAGVEYPHFNLYAEEKGKMVLMTKDHKIPVARGGKDHMENYQTMCAICNNLKGKDILHMDDLKVLRDVYSKHEGTSELGKVLEKEKVKLMTERTGVQTLARPSKKKVGIRLHLVLLIAIFASIVAALDSTSYAAFGLFLAILGFLAGALK
jgi:5-methylcytosine-specific restriction endonuclease McrA